MPPFREGPVKIDRKLSGELLHFLRDAGHGHRINIVDASYDIPEGSVVINYPGSTAEAFEAVVRLIPIEGEDDFSPKIVQMDFAEALTQEEYDALEVNRKGSHIAKFAFDALSEVAEKLYKDDVGTKNERGLMTPWGDRDLMPRLDEDVAGSSFEKGFYSTANNPDTPHTFIRTQDDLPFACVSLVVGHSQRTE